MFVATSVADNVKRFLGLSTSAGEEAVSRGLDLLLNSPATLSPKNVSLPESPFAHRSELGFRAPTDLCRSEITIRRVLLIGADVSAEWVDHIAQVELSFDYIPTDNFSRLPEEPPAPIEAYDFQIVQIPLRAVLHENTYSRLPHADIAAYEELLAKACSSLSHYLDIALAWNATYWIQSFVTNFMVPQQSPLGRLVPRDDLRNMTFFIEQLNAHLYRDIACRTNVYLLDIDQIAAGLGKHTVQDDGVWSLNHGGVLNDCEFERDRAGSVPAPDTSRHYPAIAEGPHRFYQTAWAELVAMVRTLRHIDCVKLVVFDLDDTLWRGGLAEQGFTPDHIEGWPVGVMEAACFLKKRGILLAMIGRTEQSRIVSVFDDVTGSHLRLDDFAARRVDGRLKTENMAEILEELRLTSETVVFVDDNPVERSAMQASFPDMRCLGAHPYDLRRILLWSAETQVAIIPDEPPQSATGTGQPHARARKPRRHIFG